VTGNPRADVTAAGGERLLPACAPTFRVSGKQPEIWDPVTGRTRSAPEGAEAGGCTSIPLEFPPYGSTFIVFRKRANVQPKPSAPKPSILATLEEPWAVKVDPKWGGPESVQFAQLESWSKHSDDGIKYYSGTAIYAKSFEFAGKPGQTVWIDLGDVKETAAVRLNGRESLGPRLSALKQPQRSKPEIK
jgi:hypothetical protein